MIKYALRLRFYGEEKNVLKLKSHFSSHYSDDLTVLRYMLLKIWMYGQNKVVGLVRSLPYDLTGIEMMRNIKYFASNQEKASVEFQAFVEWIDKRPSLDVSNALTIERFYNSIVKAIPFTSLPEEVQQQLVTYTMLRKGEYVWDLEVFSNQETIQSWWQVDLLPCEQTLSNELSIPLNAVLPVPILSYLNGFNVSGNKYFPSWDCLLDHYEREWSASAAYFTVKHSSEREKQEGKMLELYVESTNGNLKQAVKKIAEVYALNASVLYASPNTEKWGRMSIVDGLGCENIEDDLEVTRNGFAPENRVFVGPVEVLDELKTVWPREAAVKI